MSRILRGYLLGCIALAFVYLFVHAPEPLRLNLGDPSSDARILIGGRGASPLAEIIYGGICGLGISDIGVLRFVALAFSLLGVLLLFQYARRIWNDSIALIAAALFTTSLMWMMFADSIDQVPVMQVSGFLALWGLVRAIETKQRRFEAVALLGALACYLASYDYWLVLPAAVLFTLHAKLGDPFARGARRLLSICLAGCVVGLVAKVLFASGAVDWHDAADRKLAQPLPTLLRRFSLMFTPLFWVTVAITTWRAIRAPSLKAVIEDGVTWLFVVGLVTIYLWSDEAGPHPVTSGSLLPFYAIASAQLIHGFLQGDQARRVFAIGWLAIAPCWAFYILLSNPRAVLARDDVARVNEYFAANDGNDFVMSNLIATAPVEAAFHRRVWDALESPHAADDAVSDMLYLFETTGTSYVHAVIFTTSASRAIESSLWPLALKRHVWAATGWPYLQRRKANEIIAEYDKKVLANLEQIHAKQVLHLGNFDVYRIDRAEMLKTAEDAVPVVREIDLGNVGSTKFKLLGWGESRLTPDTRVPAASLDGYWPCSNPSLMPRPGELVGNPCETASTKEGLRAKDTRHVDRAELLVRVERACDLRVTVHLGSPMEVGVSMNEYTTPPCEPTTKLSVVVPERSVHSGINILSLTKLPIKKDHKLYVTTVEIDPMCGSPP